MRDATVEDTALAGSEPAEPPQPRFSLGPRWAVVGIFLLLAVQALAYARAFLMPVVLAILLTLVFSPLRRFLGKIGVPPGFAALLIVGSLLTALVLGLFTLTAPLAEWMDNAPQIGRQIEDKLRNLRGAAAELRQAAEQVDRITSGDAGGDTAGNAQGAGAGETGAAVNDPDVVVVDGPSPGFSVAVATPGVLAQVVFTLVLLFFLLASGDMFYEKIVHVMPSFKDKRRAVRIVHDIERKLSRYLFTITVINAGLGVSVGIAMWLLGMPSPLLFGVIGFLFNFIPYVGAILGVVLSFAVGLVSLDQVYDAFLVAAVYFGLTSIEGQFITPYFVGRSLRLNTVVVFLSVTLWAWLWSVVGMLVATPLLVTIRTLCEHIPALMPLGDFLSARGAESEDGEEDRKA